MSIFSGIMREPPTDNTTGSFFIWGKGPDSIKVFVEQQISFDALKFK
jgi:hypothetical protein